MKKLERFYLKYKKEAGNNMLHFMKDFWKGQIYFS
jgi:hypothetical protein